MGGEAPPSHDAVRAYLDSAVADAAERWVGRAADATAYADLVAAVLARREALSPLRHVPDRLSPERLSPERLSPDRSASRAGDEPTPRHTERRARARWPLRGGAPVGSIADRAEPSSTPPPVSVVGAHPPYRTYPSPVRDERLPAAPPLRAATLDVRTGSDLPVRPPGRHRTPPEPATARPGAIDLDSSLDANLNTVLDWLGRPES